MKKSPKISLPAHITVNGIEVTAVIIGKHYLEKHAHYMTDEIIMGLVMALDGGRFKPDSTTDGVEYFAADIAFRTGERLKTYRMIWLFEGDYLEIIGVVNAFRVRRK